MAKAKAKSGKKKSPASITTSSTAEYFSKNLQQVGFSSQTKAILTTLKESVDNALDACEEHGILPEIWIRLRKKGAGSLKNSDRILVRVEDNGPGISPDDVTKVFGEYLASSKFNRGKCSRGQQGIGISAATTWAQLTSASGAKVVTKTRQMRKALSCSVEVDIRENSGVMKDKEMIEWKRDHGTSVEFVLDGRIQLNGEGGLLSYINGNVLVNPHLTIHYDLPDPELKPITVKRVSEELPDIPEPTDPHPHTMKLGEFIAHSHLFGKIKVNAWLKKGFSRVTDSVLAELQKVGKIDKSLLYKNVDNTTDEEFKQIYAGLQKVNLRPPSTSSVLAIGEEGLGKSVKRIGDIDFFSVLTRRPTICDFKPVQVEVAVARLQDPKLGEDDQVQVLRFANRVPLQFDKAACAIVKAINSVNWRSYGLTQPKNSLPLGPYIIAVSVVSPFIKFKNASKETIDASEELVEEIRRALMQAGQKLARHIKRESKAAELEQRIRHIEQFGPILVETLGRITSANAKRKKKAEEGLAKLLGRDADETQAELAQAKERLDKQMGKNSGNGTNGANGAKDAKDVKDDAKASPAAANRTKKKGSKSKEARA